MLSNSTARWLYFLFIFEGCAWTENQLWTRCRPGCFAVQLIPGSCTLLWPGRCIGLGCGERAALVCQVSRADRPHYWVSAVNGSGGGATPDLHFASRGSGSLSGPAATQLTE